jgi:nucleotide-binding universal stress UspA family protein
MIRLILVPLDGSDLAAQALPFALSVALHTGAALSLVQVISRPEDAAMSPRFVPLLEERLPEVVLDTCSYLNGLANELRQMAANQRQDIRIDYNVAFGKAPASINEYAARIGADLIVLSTHGRSGILRLALGSVADELLRHTHLPTVVVRPRETAPCLGRLPAPYPILVPLDGSEIAERVLPLAVELGQSFQSVLILFHADSPVGRAPASPCQELHAGAATAYLEKVADSLRAQNAQVRTIVRPGRPVPALLTVAEELNVGLIAMTTHGRSGLRRAVYGSVADAIIRHSARPVLVCPLSQVEHEPDGSGPEEQPVEIDW